MGKAQVVKNVKNKPQGSKFNGKPKVAEAGAAKHKHSHQAHVKTQNKYKSDKKPNTQFKGKFKKDTGGGFQQQRGKKPFNKSKDGGEVKTNKFLERKALRAQKQKEKEEQYEKAKLEKEEQIKKYKKKRLEKTKALSKKTQRGQPLMKDRMQLLLKQIQEMKKNS